MFQANDATTYHVLRETPLKLPIQDAVFPNLPLNNVVNESLDTFIRCWRNVALYKKKNVL